MLGSPKVGERTSVFVIVCCLGRKHRRHGTVTWNGHYQRCLFLGLFPQSVTTWYIFQEIRATDGTRGDPAMTSGSAPNVRSCRTIDYDLRRDLLQDSVIEDLVDIYFEYCNWVLSSCEPPLLLLS